MKKCFRFLHAGAWLAGLLLIVLLAAGALCGCADKKLKNGIYTIEVDLKGGSGRASITSPAKLTVSSDVMTAEIVWSSPYYEYMIVDGVKYEPVQTEGNSTFEIPVVLDQEMSVSASTTAMSVPHEIDYTLYFDSSTMKEISFDESQEAVGSMELDYATEFAVDYYEGGYKLITLGDGSRFLVIPENGSLPEGLSEDITPLYQPIDHIYLAATAAMCLFDALDRLDAISLSGSKAESWYIENARIAMEEGRIMFAGKYSEPDYELLLENNCPLAIESLMIGHASDVKDKLNELHIAVLVDQSSNESHPLGRTEWIKLYGALLNEEEKAEAFFSEQTKYLSAENMENTDKTVAFFHISSAGYVVARKSGDYVSKMIELAGGKYVFENLGDMESGTSTVNLEMEKFFETARDADYIIYNSAIGGEIYSISDLIEKNSLLEEFKAVKEGNVWCTSQNMYQQTTSAGQMIESFHRIFTGEADEMEELPFLHRLN